MMSNTSRAWKQLEGSLAELKVAEVADVGGAAPVARAPHRGLPAHCSVRRAAGAGSGSRRRSGPASPPGQGVDLASVTDKSAAGKT